MLKLDLQLNELSKIVKKSKAKRFLIELPEGLKTEMHNILDTLKKTDKEFVFSLDTTFGACDIYETDLQKANCDSIIHFGHTKFVLNKIKQNIIYWPCYYSFEKKDIEKYIKDIEKEFKNKKITIVGPIQYKFVIQEIIKQLKKNKKINYIENKSQGRLEKNQILGCDCSSINTIVNKLDAIIYFGDGNFHFNVLANKKSYKYDFYKGFEEIENKIKPKYDALFLESKFIAIYASSKIGQNKIKIAEEILKKLKTIKKDYILLYGNEISNEKLWGLGIDFVINTACPRITDDYKNYNFPMINYNEFLEMYKKYY